MARKYTKVEQLTSIIEERVKAGETYREIGTALGLTREEVRGAMHRQHAKERKLAAGYILRAKGRPRKEPTSEEVKQHNELVKCGCRWSCCEIFCPKLEGGETEVSGD